MSNIGDQELGDIILGSEGEESFNAGYGQAQASITTTKPSGQAQAQIKQTYTKVAQAQADIKQTYPLCTGEESEGGGALLGEFILGENLLGQVGGDTEFICIGPFGQANAKIIKIQRGHGQAQAFISVTEKRAYGQAQADIKQTYPLCTEIEGEGGGAVLGQFILGENQLGQVGGATEEVCIGPFGQTQALIFVGTVGYGQAQGSIKQTYYVHGQSQACIKQTYYQHGQANALIVITGQAYGQAQGKINAFDVNQHGQSQAWIKTTYNQHGQAQARIKQTYNQYGQCQAEIVAAGAVTRYAHGQAQAIIQVIILLDTFTRVSANTIDNVNLINPPDIGPDYLRFNGFDPGAEITGSVLEMVVASGLDYDTLGLYTGVRLDNYDFSADFYHSSIGDFATVGELNFVNNSDLGGWLYLYEDELFLNTIIDSDSTAFVPVSGNTYRLRMSFYGTLVRGKVWNISDPEPDWMVSATGQTGPKILDLYADVGEGPSADTVRIDNILVESTSQLNALVIKSGQAQALIAVAGVVTRRAHGQANALIDSAKKNVYGQAQGTIKRTNRSHGQARPLIKTEGINKSGQAQAFIHYYKGFGQAQATIDTPGLQTGYSAAWVEVTSQTTGQARANIELKLRKQGQAQAHIKGFPRRHGLARATIYDPRGYGQALAYINKAKLWGQAQGKIKGISRQSGQTLAEIKRANRGSGLSRAYIGTAATVTTRRVHAQAQAYIELQNSAHGLCRAVIIKPTQTGQAQAKVLAFDSKGIGNAQAFILATVITQRCGQAQALVRRSVGIGQAVGLISGGRYLVRFNGYQLPGYAQTESMASVARMQEHKPPYEDGSLSDFVGLENKIISLQLKVLGSTYRDVKDQVQTAATIVRSKTGYSKLYIQQYDRYYEATTEKISTDKTVQESMRMLDYTVEWEAKPWLTSDAIYTLSGLGTIDTDQVLRTISNGGWTPAKLIISGTNVTVSGYTATGDFTGFVSVSGTVSNLEIDALTYTAEISGVNTNAAVRNADYAVYIGPNKTFFVVTGATDFVITYRDRWYL